MKTPYYIPYGYKCAHTESVEIAAGYYFCPVCETSWSLLQDIEAMIKVLSWAGDRWVPESKYEEEANNQVDEMKGN
ncbi:MAG TPA: hypothetical protein VH186_32865 [Chloroflexia bacterium]|nr:hypothetical protein [Chloroflexia bacterium]